MEKKKILIIGAGIAAASAAKVFVDAGLEVEVLEKSRGIGGRMATKRLEDSRADHGAQLFSVRTDDFKEALIALQLQTVERGKYPRFYSAKGMSFIPKQLMPKEIILHTEERVVSWSKNERGYVVLTEKGSVFSSDFLLCTAPIPQSLDLLRASEPFQPLTELFQQIQLDPCFAWLMETKVALDMGKHGFFEKEDTGPIAWIMSNKEKGLTENNIYTVHASASWSESHLEEPVEKVVQHLKEDLEKYFGKQAYLQSVLHRWRFSQCSNPAKVPFACSASGVFFCGDGFGPFKNVEGAFISGKNAAEQLISELASTYK